MLTDPNLSRSNARKVMIVLTDGHFTGRNPVRDAADAAAEGIIVHAITFGDGANQQTMQDLAEAGDGDFHHAPDAATLETVFRKLAAMAVLLTN